MLDTTKYDYIHTIPWPKVKNIKRQATIYKTLHRKLKIELDETHYKHVLSLSAPEGQAVPAPLVSSVVLL